MRHFNWLTLARLGLSALPEPVQFFCRRQTGRKIAPRGRTTSEKEGEPRTRRRTTSKKDEPKTRYFLIKFDIDKKKTAVIPEKRVTRKWKENSGVLRATVRSMGRKHVI